MNYNTITSVNHLLKNNKNQDYKLLSDSFNINCYKLLIDEKLYVVKFFKDKKFFSNAILAEKNNLEFLRSLNLDIFPEIVAFNKNILIINFIKNDNSYSKLSLDTLLNTIIKIH